MLKEITACEVCGNQNLDKVMDLGPHPMCDDLIEIGSPTVCKEYPIEILFCDHCITAHQRFQIPKQNLFPKTYHYRARHTQDVLNGMQLLVNSCEPYGLVAKKVLDIGCNDGSLLSFFAEKKAITFGVEPTNAYTDASQAGHSVINAFFCEDTAEKIAKTHGLFDIITFTNVFAHIEDLHDVVRGLKKIMHENSIIVIENHYMGAVLEKFQFDTFYHEHPRTYSLTSFMHIAKLLDRSIINVEFPERYNGNVRIFYGPAIKSNSLSQHETLLNQEKNFGHSLLKMSEQLSSWIQQTKTQIQTQVDQHGKLAAKAFPGRAAIPIKLLGLNENHIHAAYEKPNSAKVGYYIPGTRIPILSDTQFDATRYKAPLLNFAWHIGTEIRHYMQNLGYQGHIIDIISTPPLGP